MSLFLPTQLSSTSFTDPAGPFPLLVPWPVFPLGLVLGLSRHSDAWAVLPTTRLQWPPCAATFQVSHLAFPLFISTESTAYLTLPLGCPKGTWMPVYPKHAQHLSQSSSPLCWSCPPSSPPPNPGGHLDLPLLSQLHVLSLHQEPSIPLLEYLFDYPHPHPCSNSALHLFLPGLWHQHPKWPFVSPAPPLAGSLDQHCL